MKKGIEEYELVSGERYSTSPLCGKLVGRLPHDCHTETIREETKTWAAKSGKPLPENCRVGKVLLDGIEKSAQDSLQSVCR